MYTNEISKYIKRSIFLDLGTIKKVEYMITFNQKPFVFLIVNIYCGGVQIRRRTGFAFVSISVGVMRLFHFKNENIILCVVLGK